MISRTDPMINNELSKRKEWTLEKNAILDTLK